MRPNSCIEIGSDISNIWVINEKIKYSNVGSFENLYHANCNPILSGSTSFVNDRIAEHYYF